MHKKTRTQLAFVLYQKTHAHNTTDRAGVYVWMGSFLFLMFFNEADFIIPLMLKLETYKVLPWLKLRIKENKKKILPLGETRCSVGIMFVC